VIGLLLIAAQEIDTDPEHYLGAVALLAPGDTLRLAPGTYPDCLELDGVHGTMEQPITIAGPEDQSARFVGERCDGWTNRSRVIIQIEDSSWLTLRNLEIDCEGRPVDGVEAGYGDTPVHHVTLDRLHIHDCGTTNQENGISSFATAWDWTIKRNVIERTGTGIYLGDSNGEAPFIRGTIEDNVILDPRGYAMQIKHQLERPEHEGIPPDGSFTVIRRNVFAKTQRAMIGEEARPNLLLGHVPLEGIGMNDRYLVYGNTFFENQSDDEPLFQGEGNLEIFDNRFVNSYRGIGLWIRPHNDVPRDVAIHDNTFVCSGPALVIEGGSPMHSQIAYRNAIFSDDGTPPELMKNENVVGNLTDALFLVDL
jgi:hypothetical protein